MTVSNWTRLTLFVCFSAATLVFGLKQATANGGRYPTRPEPLSELGAWPTRGEVTLIGLKLTGPINIDGLNFETDLQCSKEDLVGTTIGRRGILFPHAEVSAFNPNSKRPYDLTWEISTEAKCSGRPTSLFKDYEKAIRKVSLRPLRADLQLMALLGLASPDALGNYGVISIDDMPGVPLYCRSSAQPETIYDQLPVVGRFVGASERKLVECVTASNLTGSQMKVRLSLSVVR